MSADVLIALVVFAFVASVTPGPNNLMLLASGVNFGFRRTVPHMLGITFGFIALVLAVGFGLGAAIERFPVLHLALKILGGGYLLYLAWRIALSRSVGEGAAKGEPLTFAQAAAFQLLNPKGWVMAIGAMAAFTDPQHYTASVLVVTGVFLFLGMPSICVWAGFGVALRNWLDDPVRLKWFNIVMGVALALSLWPMLR